MAGHGTFSEAPHPSVTASRCRLALRRLRLATLLASSLLAVPVLAGEAPPPAAPDLEQLFRDPPASARPRVWWHWMNGNITRDGIARDLTWMKRIGIAGAQNFDASMTTPQVVDHRLVYMTPEWRDAFRFAASEADRLGLELAIASSPGFTESGGPWVTPPDAMKKVVWSQIDVPAGKRLTAALPHPPIVTGPYQSLPGKPGADLALAGGMSTPLPTAYADVAVLAWPVAVTPQPAEASYSDGDGKAIDPARLRDNDLATSVTLPATGKTPPSLVIAYSTPRTIRSVRLFVAGAAGRTMGASINPVLQASSDGTEWREIARIPVGTVPTTVSFAPVTASRFRVVFSRAGEGGIPAEYAGIMNRGIDIGAAFGAGAAASFGNSARSHAIAEFALFDEALVDSAEVKAGFAVAPDYFVLPAPAEAEGVRAASVVDLTSRLRPDGTLDWTPPRLPKGQQWRILRLGSSLLGTMNHPAPAEATGLEVDKFDGDAVRRYLDHYLGMYRETVGADLMGTHGVRALVNDSIESGPSNWTPRMVAQFKARRGYDPTPWLPALAGILVESRARTDEFLYDYRRTLADLVASEHYGTMARVAHEQGMTIYSEALEDRRPQLGDDMAMRSHADIPMAAMWAFERATGPKPTYLADMRGAASVANIYGRRYVAAESLTSLLWPWAYAPRDLKPMIDLEFASGINRPVIHTSVHVPVEDHKPGLTLSIFGQYFNRNETWAEMAAPWIDYIARNSLLLQRGRTVADVAYFFGEEAPLTGLYASKPVADAPKLHAYDFVNANALLDMLGNDGQDIVSPGGARYRAIYLGGTSRRMTVPVLRKLAALVEAGATLVGTRPESSPSLADDPAEFATFAARLWPGAGVAQVGKGRVIASADIDAALDLAGFRPDFTFTAAQPGAEVLYLHRRAADGDSYFVNNRRDRPETGEARFRVSGRAPELFQPETGEVRPLGYRIEGGDTVVPLSLAPGDAIHVVFRKPAVAPALTVPVVAPAEIGRLDGPWQVSFEPGRGAPASAVLPALAPLDASSDPAIRYFSGVATYSRTFDAPRAWRPGQPLSIDLGEVREVAEVLINGQSAGHLWTPPYRLDISKLVRCKGNTLQIRVANLWVNRMIGDKQPGAQKFAWVSSASYTAKAPLRRSGLIGPVTFLSTPSSPR